MRRALTNTQATWVNVLSYGRPKARWTRLQTFTHCKEKHRPVEMLRRRCLDLLLVPSEPQATHGERTFALACLCAGSGAARLLEAVTAALVPENSRNPDQDSGPGSDPQRCAARWAAGDRAVAVVGAMLADERARLALLGDARALALLAALGAYSGARGATLCGAARHHWPLAASPNATHADRQALSDPSKGGSAASDAGPEDGGEAVGARDEPGLGAGASAMAASVHCRLAMHLQLAAELVAAAAASDQPLARRLHSPQVPPGQGPKRRAREMEERHVLRCRQTQQPLCVLTTCIQVACCSRKPG